MNAREYRVREEFDGGGDGGEEFILKAKFRMGGEKKVTEKKKC